jgi:nicotinamidase-related amidase
MAAANVAEQAASAIVDRAGRSPHVGIVLGSGLGAVADAVEGAEVIGYDELPGFPRPSVEGHAGRAVVGDLSGVPVVVLQGRAHLYEGGDLEPLRTPVRALRAAGADTLVLAGIATSGVVLSTLRQAADLDYRLTVLADACADRDEEVHRVLTEKVFPRQALVTTTDEWIASL